MDLLCRSWRLISGEATTLPVAADAHGHTANTGLRCVRIASARNRKSTVRHSTSAGKKKQNLEERETKTIRRLGTLDPLLGEGEIVKKSHLRLNTRRGHGLQCHHGRLLLINHLHHQPRRRILKLNLVDVDRPLVVGRQRLIP